MASPVDIPVIRSSLDASYRVGRVIRVDRGPIVLRPVGDGGADLELDVSGFTRESGPFRVAVLSNGGISFAGQMPGGGGGGGGAPSVIQPPDADIPGVDGTVGYDLALLSISGGGPPLRMTLFIPTGMATTAAEVESLIPTPPGSVVWFSADAASTSNPGPLFQAIGEGSAYTYNTDPLTGSLTGSITDSGTPALSPGGGGTYNCTYVDYTFNGDEYNSVSVGGGAPVSPAIFFFGTFGGGGSPPEESADTYDAALYGGDLDQLLGAETEDAAGVLILPSSDEGRRLVRVLAPELEVSVAGDEARRLSTGQRQSQDFSTEPNLVRAWMGVRNSGGDPDPGYVYVVAPSRDVIESIEAPPTDSGGPIIYVERPVPGRGPLEAIVGGGGGGGSPFTDYDYTFMGSIQGNRGRFYKFGDAHQYALPDVIPAGNLIMVGPAPNLNPFADPMRAVGESVQWLTPTFENLPSPTTVKPYTMVLGDILGSQPALVLTSSQGGTAGMANRWIGFTRSGNIIQAALVAGADRSPEILGGPSRPTAVVLNGTEISIMGTLTFGAQAGIPLGVIPSVPFDPLHSEDTLDVRPASLNVAHGITVGLQKYYVEIDDNGLPAKGAHSTIYLARQLAYPNPFTSPIGGGAVGPRISAIGMEAIDGTPYWLWVTKSGELRVSADYPDWKLAGEVQDETLSDDFSYVSRTNPLPGGSPVPS